MEHLIRTIISSIPCIQLIKNSGTKFDLQKYGMLCVKHITMDDVRALNGIHVR